jgi:hypothetical protein
MQMLSHSTTRLNKVTANIIHMILELGSNVSCNIIRAMEELKKSRAGLELQDEIPMQLHSIAQLLFAFIWRQGHASIKPSAV